MKTSLRQILTKSFLPVLAAIIMVVGIAYAVWTEPIQTPPDGNAEAPVNVGPLAQLKNGVLGVLGLMVYNDYDHNGVDVTGKVLTAQNAYGAAAWAAGGGGCYVSYKNDSTDAACITGFKNKGSAGGYGYCHDCGSYYTYSFLRPPNGVCSHGWCYDGDIGQAYVCCM